MGVRLLASPKSVSFPTALNMNCSKFLKKTNGSDTGVKAEQQSDASTCNSRLY